MTAGQKKGWRIAALLTVLGALTYPVLSAVWASKVDTSTFNTHVESTGKQFELHERDDARHRALDSARAEAQKVLTLDILCSLKPNDRRCR